MRNADRYYYLQGQDAAKYYDRLTDNPYTKGSSQYELWVDGWNSYGKEIKDILSKQWEPKGETNEHN